MKKFFLIVLCVCVAIPLFAASNPYVGKWLSTADNTGSLTITEEQTGFLVKIEGPNGSQEQQAYMSNGVLFVLMGVTNVPVIILHDGRLFISSDLIFKKNE
ncbi:MAG TPA: hypothetical protein VMV90_03470 [Rectinemataceae bacterium]|nr:hypothetical protein [Rectinemataceae bacterium]